MNKFELFSCFFSFEKYKKIKKSLGDLENAKKNQDFLNKKVIFPMLNKYLSYIRENDISIDYKGHMTEFLEFMKTLIESGKTVEQMFQDKNLNKKYQNKNGFSNHFNNMFNRDFIFVFSLFATDEKQLAIEQYDALVKYFCDSVGNYSQYQKCFNCSKEINFSGLFETSILPSIENEECLFK